MAVSLQELGQETVGAAPEAHQRERNSGNMLHGTRRWPRGALLTTPLLGSATHQDGVGDSKRQRRLAVHHRDEVSRGPGAPKSRLQQPHGAHHPGMHQ